MSIKRECLFACWGASLAAVAVATPRGTYVDPFVGTAGTGHCTPAAAYPFGMVQPGPDTGRFEWQYCSGYQYDDSRIIMFSNTHLNGTGSSGLGDVGLFPFAGACPSDTGSAFSHARETAAPGYYAVTLDDVGVRAEMTASERIAYHRWTASQPIGFFLDANFGICTKVDWAETKVEGQTLITGRAHPNGWTPRSYYFALEASAPLSVRELPIRPDAFEKTPRLICETAATQLVVRVALSESSIDGAKRNLAAERGVAFDAVRAETDRVWEGLFQCLTPPVRCSETTRRMFYTSVYRLCFQPNLLSDVGEEPFYTTFSLWDTYRAAHPLYTRFVPEKVPLFVNSLLKQGERTGYLPIWVLWGQENQGMIGVHSVPVIVDAYLKGFTGVDWPRAYEQIRQTLTSTNSPCPRKVCWDLLDRYGYYPNDIITGESVSRLLECTFDFWRAAQMAERLGHAEDAVFFSQRASLWTNVFDRTTGFMRGRDSKGNWRTPFDPAAVGHNTDTANDFTEGNAFQWTWHVLHDPQGLIAAMGGKAAAEKQLDRLFAADSSLTLQDGDAAVDVTGLIGQYAHGNEPSHHIPFLYAQMGKPAKTRLRVAEICEKFYQPRPDGLAGNDDCGQMSAWYVYAIMGWPYPVTPCGN